MAMRPMRDALKMLALLLLAQPCLCVAQSDRDSSRPELNPPIYDGPPPKDQQKAVRARREAEERKRMRDDAERRRAIEASRQQKKK
jgi:hypothetical protein